MKSFKTVLLALVLTLSVGVSSAFAGPIVIKLAHPNVPQHPMGQAFIKFKELIEERSNGAFRVDIFDSSKFGNFDSVVQGLQRSSRTTNLRLNLGNVCMDPRPHALRDLSDR